MKKYLIILFIITGNFLFVMSMNANPFIRQDTNKFKKSYVWVDFGFQIGNAKNWFDNFRSNYVVGHTVNLNYISNNYRFVKLRYSSIQRIAIWGKQNYKTYELGLMSGKLIPEYSHFKEFSIGIAVTGGAKEEFDADFDEYGGDFIYTEYVTVGIPFEIALSHGGNNSGVKLGIAGNINPEYSFIVFKFTYSLGHPLKFE